MRYFDELHLHTSKDTSIYTYIYIYIYIDTHTHTHTPHTHTHTHTHTHIYIYIYIKIRRSTERFVSFESIYFLLTYLLYIYMFPACCFRQIYVLSSHMWHKALSMRFELTLVSSINDLWLVRLVYIGVVVPISWSVFTLACFIRLWYLICL